MPRTTGPWQISLVGKRVGAKDHRSLQLLVTKIWDVRPKSLGELGQFILRLLKVDPSAQGLPYSDYKAAFHSVLSKWPEAKPKGGSVSDAAGDLADRCIVIINHARKMAIGMQAEESWNKMLELLPHKSKWLKDLMEARDIIQVISGIWVPRTTVPWQPNSSYRTSTAQITTC